MNYKVETRVCVGPNALHTVWSTRTSIIPFHFPSIFSDPPAAIMGIENRSDTWINTHTRELSCCPHTSGGLPFPQNMPLISHEKTHGQTFRFTFNGVPNGALPQQ